MANYTENYSLPLPDDNEQYLLSIINFITTRVDAILKAKQDAAQGKDLSTNDFTNEYKTKLDGLENYDDTALSNRIELVKTILETQAGFKINLGIDSNYVMTISLLNSSNEVIDSKNIDFPIESMVVNATYNNGIITLTLQNGNTLNVNISDIISGLQPEINNANKLSSDLVDDTGKTHKFVTEQEKTTWNAKEDSSNKTTSLSSSSTDTQYPSAKAVYDKFVGVETEIANIQSSRGHVYGIKRALSNNSSNAWERTDDSVGLVANATKNGGTVQNDFDNRAPWSEIKSLNYDITNKKILAYIGDPDFKFDGTNGDVYTQVPEFWYKIWQDDLYEYIQIADYAKAGFTKSDKFMGARYTMGLVDNTLRSYSGLTPARNKTIGQFRTLARAIGNEFCLLDYRFFIIRLLYLVEYASYHSQSKLGSGMSSMRFSNDDVALIAESNTNRIIINTTGGNAFYVGQTISIGTSGRENFGVAEGRKITAINAYSDGTVTGKEIIFDGDPVNIATTNVIWSSGQHSGGCDSLGMKSGCLVSDNKHAVIYRGFENPFGNVWEWLDGYNIKDNQGWVCYNPADYVSDKFEAPYKQMGYANVNTNGWSKKLGLDVNNPLIRTPIEVGGGDSTYQCDYHYQNTGNRVARVGGNLSNGTYCGLWYLIFNSTSSNALWNLGCRVLINQ